MDTNIIDLARERRRRGPRFNGGLMDILEVSRDLVCLCRAGKITAINGAGARLLGADGTESLLGRLLSDFLVPEATAVMDLFLAGKASADKAVPTRLLGLDGRARAVEMQVYRAREIAPDATVIVCRGMEQAVETPIPAGESEPRLALLLDHAANLICHLVDGRVRYINRAGLRLLGADSAQAVVGRGIADFFLEPDALAKAVPAAAAPMRLRRLDGRVVAVILSQLPSRRGVELMIEAREGSARDLT